MTPERIAALVALYPVAKLVDVALGSVCARLAHKLPPGSRMQRIALAGVALFADVGAALDALRGVAPALVQAVASVEAKASREAGPEAGR
ncbi:MAG TPA: hypothetical protein VLT47_10980 [Anaeromyxobacteraceae bacterium]|nr:hypothetical protein [Anaeromyxobacteraceae bacterium]